MIIAIGEKEIQVNTYYGSEIRCLYIGDNELQTVNTEGSENSDTHNKESQTIDSYRDQKFSCLQDKEIQTVNKEGSENSDTHTYIAMVDKESQTVNIEGSENSDTHTQPWWIRTVNTEGSENSDTHTQPWWIRKVKLSIATEGSENSDTHKMAQPMK